MQTGQPRPYIDKLPQPVPVETGRDGPLIAAFILVRLIVSTAFRMVFPFLPALARGLGVPVDAVALAVSARSALGVLGPPLGAVADLRGRKQALVGSLIVFGLSLAVIGLWPAYWIFFLGLVISGGATVVIDSSIHAYLGDRIPYARRGQATALVELGWSFAFIIGIPLVGWIMVNARSPGWNAPFTWLGLAGLLAGILVSRVVPKTSPITANWQELRPGLRQIFARAPLFGLLLAMLMTLANSLVSIVFGIWMESSFGLALEKLGAASSVIGIAGVAGVGCAILFTDRIGKRPAIIIGLIVNSAVCLLLPLLDGRLWAALAALFIFYLSFEFSLTSLLPLMTTLSIKARGVFMAATLAAFSLGDSLGALLGPQLIRTGLLSNALVTVAFNLCGLLLLAVFVRPIEMGEDAI